MTEWRPVSEAPKNAGQVIFLVWEGEWHKPRKGRAMRMGFTDRNGRPVLIRSYRTEEGEAYEITHYLADVPAFPA